MSRCTERVAQRALPLKSFLFVREHADGDHIEPGRSRTVMPFMVDWRPRALR